MKHEKRREIRAMARDEVVGYFRDNFKIYFDERFCENSKINFGEKYPTSSIGFREAIQVILNYLDVELDYTPEKTRLVKKSPKKK